MATASTVLAHFDNGEDLAHYGIKGMKWGVRRSQKELDRLAGRTTKHKKDVRKYNKRRRKEADKGLKEAKDFRNQIRKTRHEVNRQSKNLYGNKRTADKVSKKQDKKIERRYKREKAFDYYPNVWNVLKGANRKIEDVKRYRSDRDQTDNQIREFLIEETGDTSISLREVHKILNSDKDFRRDQKKTAAYENKRARQANREAVYATRDVFRTLDIMEKNEQHNTRERRRKKVKHDQITSDDVHLSHYGIKGMKWGVRRSQEELDRLAGRARKTSNRIKTDRQNRNRVKAQKAAGKHQKKLKKKLNKVERLENKAEASRLKANRKISKHLHKTLGQVKPLTDTGRVYNDSETMRENLRNRPKGNLPKNRSERQLTRQQRANDLANIKQYKKHLRSEAKANKVSGKIGIPRKVTGYGETSENQKLAVTPKKGVVKKASDFVANTTKKAATDAVKGTIERNVKTVYNEIAGNHINKKVDDILEPYKRSQSKKKKKKKG